MIKQILPPSCNAFQATTMVLVQWLVKDFTITDALVTLYTFHNPVALPPVVKK